MWCLAWIWCRKPCSGLLDCPWWRIACLVIIAACLHMVRYVILWFMIVCDIPLNKMLKLNMFLQTGSGKTYTMMGEIYEMEGRLNEDSGITPRIFEYLFTRIRVVGYLNLYNFTMI